MVRIALVVAGLLAGASVAFCDGGTADEEVLVQQGVKSRRSLAQDSTRQLLKEQARNIASNMVERSVEKALDAVRQHNRDARLLRTGTSENRAIIQNVLSRFDLSKEHTKNILMNVSHHLLSLQARAKAHTKAKSHTHHLQEYCGTFCVSSFVVDVLEHVGFALGYQCRPFNFLTFWGLGLPTLMLEQGLSLPQSLSTLSEMFSTVGYGSSCPLTDGMKLWHGFHAWAGVNFVNHDMMITSDSLMWDSQKKLQDMFGSHLAAFANLALEVVVATLTYAYDQLVTAERPGMENHTIWERWGDAAFTAFYMTMMTATTVGYGDFSPGTWWGKSLAPLYMSLTSRAFQRFGESLTGDYVTPPPSLREGLATWIASCTDTSIMDRHLHKFLSGGAVADLDPVE